MLAAGAVMRDVSGWEGAEWFEAQPNQQQR